MNCFVVTFILLLVSVGRSSCKKKDFIVPWHLTETQQAERVPLRGDDYPRSLNMAEMFLKNKRNVACSDSEYECPNGATCCEKPSGGYGCCPVRHGICCGDGYHCCPVGYSCDFESKGCRKG